MPYDRFSNKLFFTLAVPTHFSLTKQLVCSFCRVDLYHYVMEPCEREVLPLISWLWGACLSACCWCVWLGFHLYWNFASLAYCMQETIGYRFPQQESFGLQETLPEGDGYQSWSAATSCLCSWKYVLASER